MSSKQRTLHYLEVNLQEPPDIDFSKCRTDYMTCKNDIQNSIIKSSGTAAVLAFLLIFIPGKFTCEQRRKLSHQSSDKKKKSDTTQY